MNEGEFTKVAHAIVEADKEFKVNHPVYLFQRYGEILAKYHDTILAALEIAERGQWVKCIHKMPDLGESVLLFDGHGLRFGELEQLPFTNKELIWSVFGGDTYCKTEEISHWMPLPLPPEEK